MVVNRNVTMVTRRGKLIVWLAISAIYLHVNKLVGLEVSGSISLPNDELATK
jgi:hypothetical protein